MEKRISNIRNSKDGKTLLHNFSYLILLQIASYVFPLITLPYLARVIGVEGFGKIAFALAVIVWVQTITNWGFDFTATRDVSRIRHDKQQVSVIFSNVLWAKVFLMLISFFLLVVLICCIPIFNNNALILLISFLTIPGYISFPEWFFQAMEKMGYITVLSLLSKLIFTLAVFVFIKNKEDYYLQPLLTSIGYLIAGMIALYQIVVKWHIRIIKPSFSSIIQTIKNSTDVFLNTLMPNLYSNMAVFMLGVFCGTVANGKLDAGKKFVDIGQRLLLVLSRTFFPYLSRKPEKQKYYAFCSLGISFVLFLFLFISAPFLIVFFYTEEFKDSVLILQVMSISILFLSLNNIYGTNYMIINGYEKDLRKITIIASCIGLVISFPLIYYLNVLGAALAITIARFFLGGLTTIKARKLMKVHNT